MVTSVEKIESISELVNQLKTMIELNVDTEMDEQEKSRYEAHIRAKLESGKRLTAEEMRYLRLYNPTLYAHAIRIETVRRSVEEQLKHAKSKEQVEEIQYAAISAVSKKDPVRQYMIAAIQDAVAEFKKTSAYKQLPRKEEKETQNTSVPIYEYDENAYQLAYASEKESSAEVGFTARS